MMFRARLQTLAALWLSFQIVGLIGAPVALRLATASAAEQVCTCPGGDHQTCPMHHGQASDMANGNSARRCVLQNAGAPRDVALLPLAGGIGVLPGSAASVPAIVSEPLVLISQRADSRIDLPDAPPPRA